VKALRSIAAASLAACVGVNAAAPAEAAVDPALLQGQTLDFIAGANEAMARVKLVEVKAPETGAGPFGRRHPLTIDSDRGRALIEMVRSTGQSLLAAGVVPPEAGPAFSFEMSINEKVVARWGYAGADPSAAIGFAVSKSVESRGGLGFAGPPDRPVTYVAAYHLEAVRTADGARSGVDCEARVRGDAPMLSTGDQTLWPPIIAAAREQCATQLVAKMRAARVFFGQTR
jgi:hypothetical protein